MTTPRSTLLAATVKVGALGLAGALLGGCVMPYSYVQPNGGGGYYTAPAGYYSGQGSYYGNAGYGYYGGYGDYGYNDGYGWGAPTWSLSVGFGSGWPGYYGGWSWPGFGFGSWYGNGGYGGWGYPYGGWGGWGYPYGAWGGYGWHHRHRHDGDRHAHPTDQYQHWGAQPGASYDGWQDTNQRHIPITMPNRSYPARPDRSWPRAAAFVHAPATPNHERLAGDGFVVRQQMWQSRSPRPAAIHAAPRASSEWQARSYAPTFRAAPIAAPRHFSRPAAPAPVMRVRDGRQPWRDPQHR